PWLPVKPPQAARAVSAQEATNDSVLASYRAAIAFRKQHDELRLGETDFIDLPEPVLAIRRVWGTSNVTGLFNLSDAPVALEMLGAGTAIGPQNAQISGSKITLPAHGYLFLASDGAITLNMPG
ncbi:MAG: alpha-glucosidase, partial [Rhodobacteraceae bacterium]|nr:alpha-glucosidase [Paracoccaceae bacterium]